MTGEHLKLRLVAYYGHVSHGFSLPLFGQHDGANTLYTANCSIPGDHQGLITGFEPVDAFDQKRLPNGESVEIEVGSPWQDVFIWNGVPFVGTPASLWNELKPFLGDMESRAPLSLFDLAIQAGRQEATGLGRVAFNYVEAKFDTRRALGWRQQLLRQMVENLVRRAIIELKLDATNPNAVSLTEISPEALLIDLSNTASLAVVRSSSFRAGLRDLGELAAALGTALVEPSSNMPTAAPSPQPVTREAELFDSAEATPATLLSDTIIFALGQRAREISRHLVNQRRQQDYATSSDTSPSFVPSGTGPWTVISSDKDFNRLPHSHEPKVILLVLDDEDETLRSYRSRVELYCQQCIASGALVLLVPALPTTHPSRLIDPDSLLANPSTHFHAALDTAVARSPFWWGNPRRSLDRRIADVITTTVVACHSQTLRRELLERAKAGSPPILALGILPHPDIDQSEKGRTLVSRLGSESNWVFGNPKRTDPSIRFSVRINLDETFDVRASGQAIVEGRTAQQNFPEFAMAVVSDIIGRRHGRGAHDNYSLERLSQRTAVPNSVLTELLFPTYSSSIHAEGTAGATQFVITAETPTLNAVEAADRLNWRIARYTDRATVERFLQTGRARQESLPDELSIGPVRSSAINRTLATRGVDPRDVVRINYDQFREWLDTLDSKDRASAGELARPMRSARKLYATSNDDLLLRRDAIEGDGQPARTLRRIIGRKAPTQSQLKRRADIYKCWTRPAPGFTRFAIVDGALPVSLVRLAPDEVPIQDLWVIDGDAAVPALLRSRVFGLWAKATLPLASSWMARFSVGNTFGGFPVQKPFRIIGHKDGLPTLSIEGPPSALEDLTTEIERHVERALAASAAKNWRAAHRMIADLPAMKRLDELILDAYQLPSNADDISVMRRLLELNAHLDEE